MKPRLMQMDRLDKLLPQNLPLPSSPDAARRIELCQKVLILARKEASGQGKEPHQLHSFSRSILKDQVQNHVHPPVTTNRSSSATGSLNSHSGRDCGCDLRSKEADRCSKPVHQLSRCEHALFRGRGACAGDAGSPASLTTLQHSRGSRPLDAKAVERSRQQGDTLQAAAAARIRAWKRTGQGRKRRGGGPYDIGHSKPLLVWPFHPVTRETSGASARELTFHRTSMSQPHISTGALAAEELDARKTNSSSCGRLWVGMTADDASKVQSLAHAMQTYPGPSNQLASRGRSHRSSIQVLTAQTRTESAPAALRALLPDVLFEQ